MQQWHLPMLLVKFHVPFLILFVANSLDAMKHNSSIYWNKSTSKLYWVSWICESSRQKFLLYISWDRVIAWSVTRKIKQKFKMYPIFLSTFNLYYYFQKVKLNWDKEILLLKTITSCSNNLFLIDPFNSNAIA